MGREGEEGDLDAIENEAEFECVVAGVNHINSGPVCETSRDWSLK